MPSCRALLKYKTIAWGVGALILAGCGNSAQEKDDRIFFTVDTGRLDIIYTDEKANFSMQIPRGLSKLESISSFSASAPDYDSLVLSVYVDSVKHSAVFIKVVPRYEEYRDKILHFPDSIFNGNNEWSSIHQSSYTHNGIEIQQVMLESTELINLKIFFDTEQFGREVNFLMDRKTYSEMVRHVESSIGSIARKSNQSHLN
jgi:hypothetical protein